MKNFELARIFEEMAELLEILEIEWKPRAFRQAAQTLQGMSEDIAKIAKEGGVPELKKLPGIGERIAEKIIEYLETNKIQEHEDLKKKVPVKITELGQISTLGPKKIKFLYKKLGIKTAKDLEKAAKSGKLRGLPGFGETSEKNILQGLDLLKKRTARSLLWNAIQVSDEILAQLKKLKEVKQLSIAGSLRRRKETIGDIDILATSSKASKVMDAFCSLPQVQRVLAKGSTKSVILLKNNMQADLRVLPVESYGAALQYFTGSVEHNVALRKIAISKGYKLSEYGLFNRKTNTPVAGRTEDEIYKKLGMKTPEPELRENSGEIEAAQKGKLPKLVTLKDIKGDLQMHSKYSDGANTIKEMAQAAKALGYQYIAITDHSKSSRIAGGMDEKTLLKYIQEVKQVDKQVKGIKVLVGSEVDILKNGDLDYDDEYLKKLDIVLAAVHVNFKMSKPKMTERILNAMDNKHLNIFAHPTARRINVRPPIELNMNKVFEKARDTKTIMEINAQPLRLDLKDTHVKAAKEAGVKLSLGTDAHSTESLNYMPLGVYTARRGWAEPKDIVNTLPLEKLMKILKT